MGRGKTVTQELCDKVRTIKELGGSNVATAELLKIADSTVSYIARAGYDLDRYKQVREEVNHPNGKIVVETEKDEEILIKQVRRLQEIANEYAHEAKGYEQLLKHISIGIEEGFVYDLKKIKALIDLRIGK